jgi:hypothetical protein
MGTHVPRIGCFWRYRSTSVAQISATAPPHLEYAPSYDYGKGLIINMLWSVRLSACDALYDSGFPLRTRRHQKLTWVILAAILLFARLPTDADAKPGYEVHPGNLTLILSVAKRGADVISVSANGRDRVQFGIDGPSSRIEYSTKGRVSRQRIQAAFGGLGRVNVKLYLARHTSDPPHKGRCKGRGAYYQEGTYRGTIELSRQGAMPTISTKHGRIFITHRFRQVCKQQRLKRMDNSRNLRHNIETGFLLASGKGEGRTVLLEALDFASKRNPLRSGGGLAVSSYESREGIRIARKISVFIDHDSFAMSRLGEIPETVEVEPPEPFAGSALYSRTPDSPSSWTGDLTVNLPRASRIPLTGLGFNAVLCRGDSRTKFKHCGLR